METQCERDVRMARERESRAQDHARELIEVITEIGVDMKRAFPVLRVGVKERIGVWLLDWLRRRFPDAEVAPLAFKVVLLDCVVICEELPGAVMTILRDRDEVAAWKNLSRKGN